MKRSGIKFWLAFLWTAGSLSTFPSEAQVSYGIELTETNLSTYRDAWTPSFVASFNILSSGIFDPSTGQVTIIPQTSPITSVTFAVVANTAPNLPLMSFAVGLDGFSNLVPLTSLTLQQTSINFSTTNLPIYLISGNLEDSVVPQGGPHQLDILDQTGLDGHGNQIYDGVSFVAGPNASATFNLEYVVVPEIRTTLSFFISFLLLVIISHFISPKWTRPKNTPTNARSF